MEWLKSIYIEKLYLRNYERVPIIIVCDEFSHKQSGACTVIKLTLLMISGRTKVN